MLQALKLPPFGGGDTLFANQYLAYSTLSPALQNLLSGLKCIQSSAKADASKTREDRIRDDGKESATLEEVHPVVRVHPETGRKALFVNVAHTVRFEGWTEEESRGLLEFLWRWQVRQEVVCRVR
jgi:taurine dioxygenase